jgi:hypothetical protein
MDIQIEPFVKRVKRCHAFWHVITNQFPGLEPLFIVIRDYQDLSIYNLLIYKSIL